MQQVFNKKKKLELKNKKQLKRAQRAYFSDEYRTKLVLPVFYYYVDKRVYLINNKC